MIETRISNPIFTSPVVTEQSALLVRIYPQEGIGEPIELTQETATIGREGCDITLPDDSVSRKHAKIESIDGSHFVTDLASTNGTFVNECRVSRDKLRIGDRLRFGNQIFKYLTSTSIESQYHEVVFKIMTTDGLTDAYNKRYFLESLERELNYANRSAAPLSILILDVDHFKKINDTYGHMAGDFVLTELAKRAQSVLRSGEVLSRFGGEEFALLCSRATLKEAAGAAERVRCVIANTPFEYEDKSIPVTASIGVSCSDFSNPRSVRSLLEDADHWLYVAKNSGRNRVCYSTTSL